MRRTWLAVWLGALGGAGCACGGDGGPDGGPRTDASSVPDAVVVPDAVAVLDAPSSDTTSFDAWTADAAHDHDVRAMADASRSDTGCGYFSATEVVVKCGSRYPFVSQFMSEAGCETFWAFDVADAPGFATAAEAIAARRDCDARCVWTFASSVTWLRCGRRSGYEVLRSTEETCGELYRFPEGYYPSVEAYDAAHPCP